MIFELIVGTLIAVILSLIIITIFPYKPEGKNINKIRPLGFVCDRCKGKYNKRGDPLIRCKIKQWILKRFGVDINQTVKEKVEPEWCFG
jgi:hypothetical protein